MAKKTKPSVLKRMLGNDIRSIRKDKGLTIEQVADASGLHPTSIQKIESGGHEPRAKTLLLMARGLGVPPGKLLEGDAWTRVKSESDTD